MIVDPVLWPALSKLLDEYLDLPAGARSKWLANLGPEYSNVLPTLRHLLAFDESADDVLQTLPKLEEASATLAAGDRLGPYRILSTIGRGGMGVVYRAERDDGKFEQRVAIKVVPGGLNTPAFIQRFHREYRILASLEHPNIARLLDAGATQDGLQYFVMEYIEGRPIDRFCAERKLSIRERLRLILPVCDAVQFAHQKLVVHRDLKPDNILVTEQGIPKLLDFGIARVLSEVPGANETTLMAMTPAYASPEQVKGEPVSTATDVYSLGCVLYKLLTGAPPHQLQGKSLAESVHLISDLEPPKPSAMNREVDRDVDNIMQMAMRKETQGRYRSAEQFASDLVRYLNNEPVLARPATAGYRLNKYVRRHRIAVAVASGLIVLLAAFATLQAVQLRRITRERDRADYVTQFMSAMFKVSDPGEARGNSITAREILDKASRDIAKSLTRDQELQAQMMRVMGQVYSNLGLYPRAQALLEQALAIRRRDLGPSHPQTLSSMDDLALNLNRQGHFGDAEKVQRETLDLRRRVLGNQQTDTLKSMSSLATTLALEGHYAEAEKLQRETLDIQRRVPGPEHPDTLRSMSNLANTLNREGHYSEAEKLQRATLDTQRRVLGPEHPETIGSLGDLGNTLIREGRYADAEKLQRETLALRRRILGSEHPDTLVAMTDLAVSLKRQGNYGEAEKLEREALETQRRILGPEHPSTLMSMNNLSTNLNSQGRYAEAEQLLRSSLDIKRRTLGPEHPETLRSMVNLATSLVHQGRYSDAENLNRAALDVRRRVLGPVHPDVALSLYNLAMVEEREGKRDEALKHLREAVDHGLSSANSLGIQTDPDLKSLHGDPGFEALVAHAKERSAAPK